MGVSWFGEDIMRTADPAVAVSFKLSAFHTTFNICNVLILIDVYKRQAFDVENQTHLVRRFLVPGGLLRHIVNLYSCH